jgi:hypothetical protein
LEDLFPLHFPTFLSPAVVDEQGPSIDEGKKGKKRFIIFQVTLHNLNIDERSFVFCDIL